MTSIPPVPFDLAGKRIFVAGHSGMAGSAIVRRLRQEPCCEVLLASHRELDLTHQKPTENYFSSTRPDVVVMAAGRVGGILANDRYPVEFLADNLAMELNCIRASHIAGVQKLLFLGSSCIYPKFAKQPMSEDQLLTGELEPTNQWYAVAKIRWDSRQRHIVEFLADNLAMTLNCIHASHIAGVRFEQIQRSVRFAPRPVKSLLSIPAPKAARRTWQGLRRLSHECSTRSSEV